MTAPVPLLLTEALAVVAAMEWFDAVWPFDPEAQSDAPPTHFGEAELLPPSRLELRHSDGWRIGWIEVRDDVTVFVRDYAEDER